MRIVLLLLVSLAAAHAAETASADLFEPKTKTPAAVAKLADTYIKTLKEKDQPALAEAHRDFARTFLTGLTQPNVTIGHPNDAETRGLEAGKAYRREHGDKIKEIMEGYGYVPTEADGLWRFGFEVSEFKPKTKPAENWWITVLGEEGPARAGAERVHVKQSDEGVQVHVSGYLSPEGHYGHFGVGVRELVATSITPAKGK